MKLEQVGIQKKEKRLVTASDLTAFYFESLALHPISQESPATHEAARAGCFIWHPARACVYDLRVTRNAVTQLEVDRLTSIKVEICPPQKISTNLFVKIPYKIRKRKKKGGKMRAKVRLMATDSDPKAEKTTR